jgi:Uma2 family endonuclease
MSAAIAEPTIDSATRANLRIRLPYQRFDPSRIVGRMTVDEWTVFLEKSKQKSFYVNGEVIEMSGASPEHNLLSMNFAFETRLALENARAECEVLGSDQKLYVHDRLYYFPDLVIVCGEWKVDHRDALRNPAAIVEILSETTAADDRTDKFRDYQQIPFLRHYILIEQNRIAVTHFQKIEGGLWAIVGDYRALTDSLTLTFGEASVPVPLSRVYRRVTFSAPDTEPAAESADTAPPA